MLLDFLFTTSNARIETMVLVENNTSHWELTKNMDVKNEFEESLMDVEITKAIVLSVYVVVFYMRGLLYIESIFI